MGKQLRRVRLDARASRRVPPCSDRNAEGSHLTDRPGHLLRSSTVSRCQSVVNDRMSLRSVGQSDPAEVEGQPLHEPAELWEFDSLSESSSSYDSDDDHSSESEHSRRLYEGDSAC